MTWILSDVLEKKKEPDVKSLLPYFDVIQTHQQKEAMRVLISILLGIPQVFSLLRREFSNQRNHKGIIGDPKDAIRPGVPRGRGRLRDASLHFPLFRHGGSNPHRTSTYCPNSSP